METKVKTKWIILRGLGRGFGHWGSFQRKMKQHFSNDEFYFLDLPGNGLLNDKISPLKISDYISFMHQQLAATNFNQSNGPVYGIGLSLGGMIMTEWAVQEPQFFTRVFLINTSAGNFSKPWHRLSLVVAKNSIKQLLTKTIEEMELNSLLVTTGLSADQIRKDYHLEYHSNIQFTKDYPIKASNILRQLIAAVRYHFPEKLQTPAVIINGAKDRFVSPVCSVHIHEKWETELLTHPTAGHDIAFEDGEWLIENIQANIEK